MPKNRIQIDSRRSMSVLEVRLLGETAMVRAWIHELIDDFVERGTLEILAAKATADAAGTIYDRADHHQMIGRFVGLLAARTDISPAQRDGLMAVLLGRTPDELQRSLGQVDAWLEQVQSGDLSGVRAAVREHLRAVEDDPEEQEAGAIEHQQSGALVPTANAPRHCQRYCNAMLLEPGAVGPRCPHCDHCEYLLRLFAIDSIGL